MPATLANLIENDNGLRVFCDHCGRCVDLEVNRLIDRYGSAMPLPEIGRRSRCTRCGEKGGSVQVVAVGNPCLFDQSVVLLNGAEGYSDRMTQKNGPPGVTVKSHLKRA